MATKLWTSSRLITTNMCMVGNVLISSKNYLEHCCNAIKPDPTHFGHRISSRSRTQLEVGSGCGHQTLDIISSHPNKSVHGWKSSYFYQKLFGALL